MLQRTIQLHHSRIVRILRNYWAQNPTDLVLSVIPHFNRCLAQSIRAEMPNAAFVTLLTDLADYPPNFWIVPESEFIICGSARAKQQALAMGHPKGRVCETSGMILKPTFYRKPEFDRAAERIKLGLQPDMPTGIVMFGGHGSASMLEIAKKLEHTAQPLQLIFLCGHNLDLAVKLRDLGLTRPAVIEGFTTKVDYFMSAGGFLHWQAGTRQHQRGTAIRPAGDHRAQRQNHAAGTLQRNLAGGKADGNGGPGLQGNRACRG